MTGVAACLGLALGIVFTLVLGDCLTGRWFRTDRNAALNIVSNPGPVDQLLIVFPGFAMAGDKICDIFRHYLGPTDAMIVVEYAEREIDITDIGRRLVVEIERIRPSKLRLYGASMGGMCAADFLCQFHVGGGQQLGTVLVLDTSPSAVQDVRTPRILSKIGSRYCGGPISSLIWWLACQAYPFAPNEPNVDPALVDSAQRAFAAAGTPRLLGQARYIERFSAVPADRWNSPIDRAIFLRGAPAGGDPVITLDAAVVGWQKVFPDLIVAVFAERVDKWHVPIVERPQETMTMLMNG